jgi:hypothetical protein
VDPDSGCGVVRLSVASRWRQFALGLAMRPGCASVADISQRAVEPSERLSRPDGSVIQSLLYSFTVLSLSG